MTKDMEELIDFLDKLRYHSEVQVESGHKSDRKKWKNRKAMLTKIMQILRNHAAMVLEYESYKRLVDAMRDNDDPDV